MFDFIIRFLAFLRPLFIYIRLSPVGSKIDCAIPCCLSLIHESDFKIISAKIISAKHTTEMWRPAFLKYFILFTLFGVLNCDDPDSNGYVVYCPCMGRFGNQADHFLGALSFAHGLNRTLVLPHWVEYRLGESKSTQVSFDTYFAVDPLKEYHRVMPMQIFIEQVANTVWPEDKRVAFCYVTRGLNGVKNCNAKEGNPFGPFWDTFNVDFVGSEFYAPLHYDVNHGSMAEQWKKKYPVESWPVLAFTGAPATFPVQEENRILHKYLKWNEKITEKAKKFIKTNFNSGGFIGVHLRNGPDWVRACQHVSQSPSLFAAAQCIGYRQEYGVVTQNMCLPTKYIIIRQLKRLLKTMKDVKYIFVASDSNHMIDDLSKALYQHPITVRKLQEDNPHLDLAILGAANHFVGNCVSSYTAFVKRERDVLGLPSSFWGFPSAVKRSQSDNKSHDEL